MKYFTKEWYAKMQVVGFLVFPETERDWEEIVAWYQVEGKSFDALYREELDYRKQDLLKFLPESFHPYIHAGTLRCQFPSTELREMAERWRQECDERNEVMRKEYRSYYHGIKDSLPSDVVQIYEKSLHDAKVQSLEMPTKDTFIMILDCRRSFHYYTDVKLTFTGVKKLQCSDIHAGSYWLYDEIYDSKAGFELRVLFESPLAELTIIADHVVIEVLDDGLDHMIESSQ